MSKKKGKTPQPAAKKMTASAPKMEAFTFGEPVPVNAITTRSDAEKIKSAPPPARSAFPASPARFMGRF